MIESLATLSTHLRKVEDAIWARISEFEIRFCHGAELLKVRFGSEGFETIFLNADGATWVDSFTLEELSEFLQDNPL